MLKNQSIGYYLETDIVGDKYTHMYYTGLYRTSAQGVFGSLSQYMED